MRQARERANASRSVGRAGGRAWLMINQLNSHVPSQPPSLK